MIISYVRKLKRNYYHFEGRGESQISGKGKLRLEWGGEGRSERARGEESMTTSPMGLCNPLREGTVQTGWEEWTGRHTDPQSHLAVVGTTTDTRTHMLITSPRTYMHTLIALGESITMTNQHLYNIVCDSLTCGMRLCTNTRGLLYVGYMKSFSIHLTCKVLPLTSLNWEDQVWWFSEYLTTVV